MNSSRTLSRARSRLLGGKEPETTPPGASSSGEKSTAPTLLTAPRPASGKSYKIADPAEQKLTREQRKARSLQKATQVAKVARVMKNSPAPPLGWKGKDES
jgi:hypothetical protein